MNKRMTIDDIAKELEVSKTTVSRAISGKGRISDKTRQRVLSYIEEMDYMPNSIAKSLAQSKTYNIAVVIPGDCDLVEMPFFQNSLQGICEQASKQDYDVMMVMLSGNDLSNLARIIANHKVDGVILSRSVVKDDAAIFLKEKDIPFVLMGTSKDKNILQADNNHRAACKELTTRLIEQGYEKIGLIGADADFVVNRIRLQGFKDAFTEKELALKEQQIFKNCDDIEQIEEAVKALLQQNVSCMVCMDDRICSQVLQILNKLEVFVPKDMKIASFYDSSLLKNHEPAITSLLFNDKALGALTCSILLNYIQGYDVNQKTLMGYEIVCRESTQNEYINSR